MYALLSLLVPGVGQLFQERVGRGLGFFLLASAFYGAGYAASAEGAPLGTLLFGLAAMTGGIVHLASVVDAMFTEPTPLANTCKAE